MVVLALAMTTCSKDNSVDPIDKPGTTVPGDTVPGTVPNDTVKVVMQTVALSGTVRDANGNPLSGVRVTTGSLSAVTGSDGMFAFDKAGTVGGRIIMQLTKSGYFSLTRSCAKDDIVYIEAMLYPQGNSDISLQTTFDASTAKTLQIGDMRIDFPASSIMHTDGSAYSGNVSANVLYLAPDSAISSWLMPGGDLACKLSNNDEEVLLPYGIANVVLTDNAGNKLQIKEDAGVEISFPIPSVVTGNPSTVSLWSFDEANGIWTEEGTLTQQGNVYKGAVKHFSPEAVGKPYKNYTMKVRVLACDEPKAGAYVQVLGRDLNGFYFDYYGVTNSDGYCTINLVINDNFTVYATYNGVTKSMDAPMIDYQLQIIQFQFDCPPEGFPEKMAIKRELGDETEYLTFDNSGLRWRYDEFDNYGTQLTNVYDHLRNVKFGYWDEEGPGTGSWGKDESLTGDDSEQLLEWGQTWFLPSDDGLKSQGFIRRPDATILGKVCSVWAYPDGSLVYYSWNRIRMRQEWDGDVIEVTAITENVPDVAFSKTTAVSWIK